MSNREVSSLDRFVTTRGPILADIVSDSRRLLVMTILSTLYGVVGTGFIAGAAAGGDAVLPLAITGGICLATGGLVGGIRAWLKFRLKPEQTTRAELTAEAKELLCALIDHVQGRTFGRGRRRRLREAMRRGITNPARTQRSEDLLAPEAFRLLDSAASQYNRILGVIDGGIQEGRDGLTRFSPDILAAADTTMAQLLDAAVLLNRLPETARRLEAEVHSRVQELTELADEVERLRTSIVSSPTLAEGVSPVRHVLEELRADQRARDELRRSWAEPEEQQLEVRVGREE
jgi:hypothetical protein